MSDLLVTLNIVIKLSSSNVSVKELACEFSLSVPTIKRHLAEARHLGADIVSVKVGSSSSYRLLNWSQIQKRVITWHALEVGQSFV